MELKIQLFILAAIAMCVCTAFADCDYDIVESMPEGLELEDPANARVVRTHESLIEMVNSAQKTLRIASFYWYLTPPAKFMNSSATEPGIKLMDAIKSAATRGVNLEVLLDGSGRRDMSNPEDVAALRQIGTVKQINMTRLLKNGVMHSKFMIVDNSTFYVGSSNFDWRSYTEIKEMGLTFKDCFELASDLDKIFRAYMLLADSTEVPDSFGDDLKTSINMHNPFIMKMGNSNGPSVFLTGSPPAFNGKNDWTGRTDDIDGLLHLIDNARHRISISVMNYSPRTEFIFPKQYWPRIDDALRRAATTRRVKVELLFSNWSSTKPSELAWYKSLNAVQSSDFHSGGIHVKLFKVPAFDDYQRSLPFARVKHDKYMVTDSSLFLGTSNWTPDYFINTAGVSLILRPTNQSKSKLSIVNNFQEIFDRDFGSKYAQELSG